MEYIIRKTDTPPALAPDQEDAAWTRADVASIACVRPESSDHRPETRVRMLFDEDGLYGRFSVRDRYVRCVHTRNQDPVCRDSCVEFFCKPHAGPGYFNFEFNCGGAVLCSYIRDHTRIGDDGFRDFTMLTPAECDTIRVASTLPPRVDPEIAEPVAWTLTFAIPLPLLEAYAGPLRPLNGKTWTGNFYKCGDRTSHPHWLSWSPVRELNFHLPECFAPLRFENA